MKNINLRSVSQLLVIVIILWLAFAHQNWWIEKAAPVDAYCPFWALENIIKLATSWEFLQRIYFSNYILLIIFVIMTIVFGRVFCWFFCPLGALQEWLRLLWKKLWIKKEFELPSTIDKYWRYFKYVILVLIVVLSYKYWELIFRYYDPFVAFSHLWNEFEELYIAYSILWLILILSLFTKNWWCRYFCPLGAFFWIIRKISFFKLIQDEKTCIKCSLCNKSCPVNLDIKDMKSANSAECISCLKCVKVCPKNSLSIKIANKQINKWVFNKVVVFWFFILLIVMIFLPFRQTKSFSNIKGVDWKINIENLRWSNTLEYLIKESWVPLEYYQEKLKLPKDIKLKSKIKHIWEDYNIKNSWWNFIETEDFKSATEEYLKNK